MGNFNKSDVGAQSAWKGFTSQTLYIAYRLVSDTYDYEYYPEDLEDLIIKKDGNIIEAVQIKNISANLSLSSLASTKTSKGGEGFFNRMCNLHHENPTFGDIRIVYFGALGAELQLLKEGKDKEIVSKLSSRLESNHGIEKSDAEWLIKSLKFEAVSSTELNENISKLIHQYVPTMAAPDLAQELLIQYVSRLSHDKGFTTLQEWQENVHSIGVRIVAIDGFYKEYNKSLVRLSELQDNSDMAQLKNEFQQGVSAHPVHIRSELDFKRSEWIEKICIALNNSGVALVKGVSGQGKSTLCYRYLIDNYSEKCVFCVRSIATEDQALNLVVALTALSYHHNDIIIYIDVKPGETHWAFMLQEMQARGLQIPVLISIREEDYNVTPTNGKSIKYDIIDLELSEAEAKVIFDIHTLTQPSPVHRTFDDAWQSFDRQGPFIEFMYFLSNNQTLKLRLEEQILALLQEGISDEWVELLKIVCYAGKLGCSVGFDKVKGVLECKTMHAAIRRLKDEYLIRVVDNKIEAMHPVRAQIILDVLCSHVGVDVGDVMIKTLPCVDSQSVRIVLLEYFTRNNYRLADIKRISNICFTNWEGYANVIKSALWLDVKRYVEKNIGFIHSFVAKYGQGWLCFLPLDLSGIYHKNELIADSMKDLSMFSNTDLERVILETKEALTSLTLDYEATDFFIKSCALPKNAPNSDIEKTSFGYTLFWLAKRGISIDLEFDLSEMISEIDTGEIQSCADAIRGLAEHPSYSNCYQCSVDKLIDRMIAEMNIICFDVSEEAVNCKFVPPLINDELSKIEKNHNQYWRLKMLDILKQLYPQKEYINIELIGVDILKDLGIDALDYKLHIHKSKITSEWVSEVNGWAKVRIDYDFRPITWDQYVHEIDELRKDASDLISQMIRFIDDIYKKGRYTKERWKRVDDRIKKFNAHIFAENKLPKFAVDPYCLYSESNLKREINDCFPMRQLLSVSKYEQFRKLYNDVYSSLENFFNQFATVLLVRYNHGDIGNVSNPKLAMFNLYSSAKALFQFQKEYAELFSEYTSLSDEFIHQELEGVLTLVNVWRHVLDNEPKGYAIAYNSKQKYRKGNSYFSDMLEKARSKVYGELIVSQNYAYFAKELLLSDERTLEDEYLELVLELRGVFSEAILPSSERWYVETQSVELAYLPLVSGCCFPTAFSIPFYKLLDVEESKISKPMFPCAIATEVEQHFNMSDALGVWSNAMQKISLLIVYLKRYAQVEQVPTHERCLVGVENYITSLIKAINNIQEDTKPLENLVSKLLEVADGQEKELLEAINLFFDCYDDIRGCITGFTNPNGIISSIELMMGAMIQLQSYVQLHNDCVKER